MTTTKQGTTASHEHSRSHKNVRTMGGVFLGLLLLAFCAVSIMTGGVAAAKSALGAVRADDFTVQGITLGKAATAEQLTAAYGKILYDDDLTRWGVPLKRYTFQKDIHVFVERRTQRVAEIVLEKQAITGRGGIRYGATSYYIQKIYGKAQRELVDTDTCYV